ncbi:MAG TPA: GFA family protein, partial [Xanthobacteraceae bacterium]
QQFECLSGRDALTTYRFGTGTAQHTFCKTCGVHPFYVPRSDPDKIDVNVRCLDDFGSLAVDPKPFDGRNWDSAIEQNASWR